MAVTEEFSAASANGQPAFASCQRGPDGAHRARAMLVLTVRGNLITRIAIFLDPGLFGLFGLPGELPVTVRQPTAATPPWLR
jgi:hypothetical protein